MLLWRVRKHNSGFTLIEMIAVVIMIGIIAAIAAPNLLGMLNRYRVDEAMRQIEGGLKEAQKQAERRGKQCTINISTTNNNNALSNPAADGCLLSNRSLNDLVQLNSSRAAIAFSGKGNILVNAANPAPVFVVSIPNGTNSVRCVVIQNSFGTITTGNYTGDLDDPLSSANCQQIDN